MLKNDIGTDAGVIWHLLEKYRKLSIKEMVNLTNLDESIIMLSLGWLAREDKVAFSNEDGNVFVELTNSASEIYF